VGLMSRFVGKQKRKEKKRKEKKRKEKKKEKKRKEKKRTKALCKDDIRTFCSPLNIYQIRWGGGGLRRATDFCIWQACAVDKCLKIFVRRPEI
jgi:hypothetical protein